jgi:hypothetical protein
VNRTAMSKQGYAQISGEQIAGSRGQHRERNLSVGQHLCGSANGSITAHHDEHIRIRGDRASNGLLTVVDRIGLKPVRVLPAEFLFFRSH